jgi:AcrR family transcriptional regulator
METSKPDTRERRYAVITAHGKTSRMAILNAVAKHLECTPWHAASVAGVMREASQATSSFYQYFPDLPEAVRTLTMELKEDGEPVPPHVQMIADLLAWEHVKLPKEA